MRPEISVADPIRSMEAAVERDDIGAAVSFALEALGRGQETPLALNLAAFDRENAGHPGEALPLLDRALRIAPADPLVHNAVGRVFSKLGRASEALPAFDRAIELAPGYSAAYCGRGLTLEILGRPGEAAASLGKALELDPANVDALAALAALAVAQEQEGGAALAEQALAIDPWQPAATLALATLDQRAGRLDAVKARLTPVLQHGGLTPLHEAATRRMLADVLDAQGRPREALAEYDHANRLLRQVHAELYTAPEAENGVALCERLSRYFSRRPTWPAAPGDAPAVAASHVFLVGFPRSGTTLLEQVLATHPDVAALEERPTLGDVGAWFASDADLDRLAAMDEATAERLRADYWTRVQAFGVHLHGRVFVDKQPLNTLWLPYIAKLFPDAKILFARRDPRDVVLSCFRRRFRINGATYHFTDLEDLARFYAAVMELAEVYRERLDLAWHIHRHEDLVEAFDAEVQAICGFLGLSWTEAMRDFAETAKRRDVRTPSAAQVRRGLYREGMGQWRNYADGMTGALKVLEPWVERFGYPAG